MSTHEKKYGNLEIPEFRNTEILCQREQTNRPPPPPNRRSIILIWELGYFFFTHQVIILMTLYGGTIVTILNQQHGKTFSVGGLSLTSFNLYRGGISRDLWISTKKSWIRSYKNFHDDNGATNVVISYLLLFLFFIFCFDKNTMPVESVNFI